jgi:glutamate synthase domain-containing protein 2
MTAMIPARYSGLLVALLMLAAGLLLDWLHPGWFALAALGAALGAIGVRDLTQTRRAVLRNYPILGHARYMMESIRPEMRQYFIEDDDDEVPFSRQQRAIVYQRSKSVIETRPFGTERDVYRSDYEWINHSMQPLEIHSHDFRITIGDERAQPYSASVFNISAMSFGSLSANAVLALNAGARRGHFYHDTGEGSISRHHRVHGGDLVWEIGTGYFGCRDEKGRFDPERFAANAADPQVKMIEIKLSQGAKPGQGGLLPAPKVTHEIAEARGVLVGCDVISPPTHSAFDTPLGLMQFITMLRELSGGKPVGIKLAIGHPWEWFAIARAMLESGILPDFIVVDGAEGGTGAAPLEFIDHVGVPMREALLLVHNTLVGTELRARIRLGAAGKLVSAFDLARTIAMGADWCNSGRGFMFALGCIQARSCHTDRCPTGVTTQDPRRQAALVVEDKATRVYNYHQGTLRALKSLIAAAGVAHPCDLGPHHIIRRVSQTQVRSLAALHSFLEPGALLDPRIDTGHIVFDQFWAAARADSFASPPGMLGHRRPH